MGAHRIVDIVEHGRHLALDAGFLTVSVAGKEIGRVPIDDVLSVVVSALGCSYTNPLVTALAARGAVLVACGAKHLPVAWVLPVDGHHAQAHVMAAQASAPTPLNKRLWQFIVRAKLRAQADALETAGGHRVFMDALIQQVDSGDPKNVEATAAQRYWPALFGAGFVRDRGADGANALLNYGYTLVRSAVARFTVAAGLHPGLAIKHRRDPLALTDDLMEPFRPVVDTKVLAMVRAGRSGVTREARVDLASVLDHDIVTGIQAFTRLVAQSYLDGTPPRAGKKHVVHGPVRPANDVRRGAEGGG